MYFEYDVGIHSSTLIIEVSHTMLTTERCYTARPVIDTTPLFIVLIKQSKMYYFHRLVNTFAYR